MKRLFFIFTSTLLMYSCGTTLQTYTNLYYTDYTKYYYEDGIIVSSLSDFTGNPYIALGDIMVEHCEGQKITGKNLDKKDAQQMLDMLVEQAKYKGANGILSVRINKQDITWYTQGVAVRFEKAPSLQKQSYIISHNNKENNTHALSVAESDKIASETANYLWEHKMRFLKSDGIYGDRYFDIENNEYITDKAYIKKYGEPIISKITNMLKEKKLNEKTYKKEIKKRAK